MAKGMDVPFDPNWDGCIEYIFFILVSKILLKPPKSAKSYKRTHGHIPGTTTSTMPKTSLTN